MKNLLMLLLLAMVVPKLQASDSLQTIRRVYMIPGQGSDTRIFKNISIPGKEVILLSWITPGKNETMHSLAKRMAQQIDTTEPFALVGVSLGGMICCEMSTFLHPGKVIIISSASSREEIPLRWRMLKYIPIYKIIPAGMIKASSRLAQTIVEPDRKKDPATCDAMLRDKDKLFLKRTIYCIANWDPPAMDSTKLVHIHGTNDHTLPFRLVKADYRIENGSHMMTLTRGEEISALLNKLL